MWSRNSKLAGIVFACVLAGSAPAKVDVGDVVPALGGLGLAGDLPDLSGKVVVLDVWASWCAPCKASFPALSAFYQEFNARGVEVVAVSVDRNERQYAEFVRRHSPSFPTVRDAAQRFAPAFEPPAMPTTYVIDRDGRVRNVHRGFHGGATVEQLRADVQRLLEEAP